MVLAVYMLFVLGIALAAFLVLRAGSRRENPPNRQVLCPETMRLVHVEADRKHEWLSLARGRKEVRLRSCSSWPERAHCDQDCLAQIEPATQVECILGRWYVARNCATCGVPVVDRDWKRGRAAALDTHGTMIELRDMNWRDFPMVLEIYQPICWNCHQAELIRRRRVHVGSSATG